MFNPMLSYRPAPRYDWFVCLERHPEHVNLRDPRRAWQYSCCTGKHSAEDYNGIPYLEGAERGDRVYYFENEHDMLMFSLRWQSSN